MRILVTGRHGQIARSLAERAPQSVDVVFAGRPQLDLASFASIEQVVADVSPDVVISAAAYTAVDLAEDQAHLAMRLNGEAPGALAAAARRAGARVVHLSTDYVFDGAADRPYRPTDAPCPISVYGRSKLMGEDAIKRSGVDYTIARVSWVYSPFGGNFVKTMLRLAGDRDEIGVVNDQQGCPTSALDIADALWQMIGIWRDAPAIGRNCVLHIASPAEATWAVFAKTLFAISEKHGGPAASVRPIVTSEFPTRARRPANSRLDSSEFEAMFDHRLPDWSVSLPLVLKRLLDHSQA